MVSTVRWSCIGSVTPKALILRKLNHSGHKQTLEFVVRRTDTFGKAEDAKDREIPGGSICRIWRAAM
jgi:hypothetical protein